MEDIDSDGELGLAIFLAIVLLDSPNEVLHNESFCGCK